MHTVFYKMTTFALKESASPSFPIFECFPDSPDENWVPSEFWRMPHPPKVLYIQGRPDALRLLQSLPDYGLGIVGSRDPQPRSLQTVRTVVHRLRSNPLIILSGFARGIDTQAHIQSLEAGLPTIAILGCGIDIPYPAENQRLKNRILLAGGLIVSEFPRTLPPLPHNFLQRNRLIAAWSKAIWVVEARRQSGALNTAKWAREYHHSCFATPCYPGDPSLFGNQVLLDRDHAIPLWGAHSLGQTWIELAAQGQLPSLSKNLNRPLSDPELLTQIVFKLTTEKGGAQVQELLDWAVQVGWTPQRFFEALQTSLQSGRIEDRSGILVSPEF